MQNMIHPMILHVQVFVAGTQKMATAWMNLRRPAQFCDASHKTKTPRTIFQRLAVKLGEAPKNTAARPILRRPAQFCDALPRTKTRRPIFRCGVVSV
jgi:hypothetical protein